MKLHMADRSRICEACEREPVDTFEPCDAAPENYWLCWPCHHRLHKRALRPSEWYNLAKRHGWQQFLLHDDFYDEAGIAQQPEGQVEDPQRFPAPSLSSESNDARLLLDYTITRWQFEREVRAAWATLKVADVSAALAERFASAENASIRSCILEVCAAILKASGAPLVRYAWGEYPASVPLPILAQASAACLPFREGFDRVVSALDLESPGCRRDLAMSLAFFKSTEALDWIEHHVSEPITEAWGELAAVSRFSWTRAEKWITAGRPLSLVAVDALATIANPKSPLLRDLQPRLYDPSDPDMFREVLSAYAQSDRAPRVEKRTISLLANAHSLLERETLRLGQSSD